ncbi:NmrA-like family protein [Hypomontagnella monticulosa]|nr:NmrA-like family protein [Hypomontagnella monticulosa]
MAGFQNVLFIGASGSIGSVLLNEFRKEATFTLTILQRASSNFEPPAGVKLITIPDSYPSDDLVAAFRGQDVVINCMTTLSVANQFRMIDAAIAAGVRRYVPSEFGLNNMKPEAQALNSVFHDKAKVQEYIRAKAADGSIEWMSITCGLWLKWVFSHDWVGAHVRERKFVFWDDGEGYFSCTTEENTAAGMIKALRMPEETKNKNIFLSDFAITQKQLLAAIEKAQGVKYTTETINSEAFIKEKKEAVRNGDTLATFDLIKAGFATGRFGGHLEKEPGEIMNDKLGLPKHTLDGVVADALGALGFL